MPWPHWSPSSRKQRWSVMRMRSGAPSGPCVTIPPPKPEMERRIAIRQKYASRPEFLPSALVGEHGLLPGIEELPSSMARALRFADALPRPSLCDSSRDAGSPAPAPPVVHAGPPPPISPPGER
eukprot:5560172-Alexandrium_andersonii.AAC.1